MPDQNIPQGHQLIAPEDLTGTALAWACCAVWQLQAAILNGSVHVEVSPGNWQPFDPAALLRAQLLELAPNGVLVPDEIVPQC